MVPVYFKKFDSWFLLIVMIAFISFYSGVSVTESADNPLPGAGNHDGKEQELLITADRLDADVKEGYSEFSGNVKATQGDTVIAADRIRIYFKSSRNNSGKLSVGEDAVEKITASGHVKINTGDIIAAAGEASYINASRLLVLSGPDSTVKSGKNSITGSKITLDRATGRITVENSAENQVRALFFTDGKVLD